MAFDAGFTAAVVLELQKKLSGARIEKIYQPSRDSVLLHLHCERKGGERGDTVKLLIDAGVANPRMGLSDPAFDNPKVPPMFCMLLRKHLGGGKLISVKQLGFDRAVLFDFESRDEMGYLTKKYLIAEIMGKFSNLIFCDESYRVIGAVHIHDLSGNVRRPILPGVIYSKPAPQEGKISPLDETPDGFSTARRACPDEEPAKWILNRYAGFSPLVAREIAFGCHGDDRILEQRFFTVVGVIKTGRFTPCLLIDPNGTPADYSFIPIEQYGTARQKITTDSFSSLLDTYFAERSRNDRIRQRAADILRLLTSAEQRLTKKLAAQQAEWEACADKEIYRRNADLITANIYRLSRGMHEAVLENYYEPDCPLVRISLDTRLTPAQNAQRLYKKYNKCKSAEVNLAKQMAIAREELAYLDTVFDALTRAETETDLAEIRRELCEAGYALRMKTNAAVKIPAPKLLTYRTSGGYLVRAGKNNVQNDYLTHKLAGQGDIWFHIKGYPGSHTVLFCDGAEPSAADFTEAAVIAAVNSKAPSGQKAEVDYTRIKFVKKPAGAKPGFVTFSKNYSAYVTADRSLADRLKLP